MMRRRAFLVSILALLAQGALARATPPFEPLDIVTSSGTHHFEVEIANDFASRERGLMYRRFMPADHGMLFEFDVDEPVTFWMKNTYISLDMVFIGPHGIVTHVAARAEPLSERIVPSDGPCIAVLELNAGEAEAIGVKPGDTVKAAFFSP